MTTLNDILDIEDQGNFDAAFESYVELYKNKPSNFDVWKHFYFFLWTAIEDAPSEFQERVNLRQRMQEMYEEGKRKFQHLAEFKFLTGYTISIFPYEFGDYDSLEKEGKELLRQAYQEELDNEIYKMAYLGSLESDSREYRNAEIKASEVVLSRFNGPGLMNSYFRQVLNRKE